MWRNGLRIRYAPDALAHHWHPTSLEAFLARSLKMGRAAVHFAQLWPELNSELLEPEAWFADRPRVLRQLLGRMVRWRWLNAALLPVARTLADRPPGRLQPWAGRLYWLIVLHHRFLGIGSAQKEIPAETG
jgi:hypothetical protein